MICDNVTSQKFTHFGQFYNFFHLEAEKKIHFHPPFFPSRVYALTVALII